MDSLFVRAMQFRPGDSMLGRSFRLPEGEERGVKEKHLALINQYARREVSPDEVHVRGMLLTNTQRDYYYSRFTKDALEEQADLIPGAPVMAGHDYRRVPDARFFSARVVRIEDPSLPKRDQYWTECLYYIPKDTTGDEYVRRVDLGVYSEVSIGFRLASTPCSVCKKQIWQCEHIPGDVYERSGICEWGMEGITSVLEGSQVFRGGQKDTSNFIPEGYGAEGARLRSSMLSDGSDLDARTIVAVKRANADLIRSAGMSFEDFFTSPAGQRAIGFGALFGKRGERSNTQSVLCAKSRFSDVKRAARWARDNDFRADKRKENDEHYIFEQFPEASAEPGSLRNISMDEGVSARICRVRTPESEEQGRVIDTDARSDESLEAWLARGAASS